MNKKILIGSTIAFFYLAGIAMSIGGIYTAIGCSKWHQCWVDSLLLIGAGLIVGLSAVGAGLIVVKHKLRDEPVVESTEA